jgi:PEP-CTERM motif
MRTKLFAAAALFAVTSVAGAANLAVFGQNNIGNLYSASNSVTYVTDAQLATAGFLNSFDAFVFTRDGSSFGNGLSVAAAANVKSFVTGNVVLFNGDFQDDIGAPQTNQLFNQALSYVLSNPKGGYIGEYIGSFSAFATNDDGRNPIGLIGGNSGVSGYAQGGSEGDVEVTAYGLVSPITAGVAFPYNPGAVEFSATVTNVNPAQVLARYTNGNAAIIAGEVSVLTVPEPETYAMLLAGMGLMGAVVRRRNAAQK